MRSVEWIRRRWVETGLSIVELSDRSGVSRKTLQRIDQAASGAGTGCRGLAYTPSRATLRLLAGPLQCGPASVNYLIANAEADFNPATYLDYVAGPVQRTSRGERQAVS